MPSLVGSEMCIRDRLQLDKAKSVAINGLDGYALPTLIDRFKYAKPKK